jgi:hypothetical protein
MHPYPFAGEHKLWRVGAMGDGFACLDLRGCLHQLRSISRRVSDPISQRAAIRWLEDSETAGRMHTTSN